MKYQFTLNTTASDLWQLSMYALYGSIFGASGLIFTAMMILLAIRFYSSAHVVLKGLLILGSCLFPVIQPLFVYLRAIRQAKNMPKEVHLSFDEQGMHVRIGVQKEDIDWNSIKGITKKPTLLIIFTSAHHGYVLNNKVLGKQRDDFYNYIHSMKGMTGERG
jgi:hypothetical protein